MDYLQLIVRAVLVLLIAVATAAGCLKILQHRDFEALIDKLDGAILDDFRVPISAEHQALLELLERYRLSVARKYRTLTREQRERYFENVRSIIDEEIAQIVQADYQLTQAKIASKIALLKEIDTLLGKGDAASRMQIDRKLAEEA